MIRTILTHGGNLKKGLKLKLQKWNGKTWQNNTLYGIDVFCVMCDTTRLMGDLKLELKYWA